MWGIRDSHWSRSVRRILLGRKQDYRLVYWIVEEDTRVMPVLVSPVTRAEGFEYPQSGWLSNYHEVFGHYFADTHEFGPDSGRYRYFTYWPPGN